VWLKREIESERMALGSINKDRKGER